jgi:flagellar motility protein MotE (MotC chaperone)
MKRFLREVRLVPIVLFATIALFALKTVGLVVNGHYALDNLADEPADITGTIPGGPAGAPPGIISGARDGAGSAAAPAPKPGKQGGKQSWAQQMFNYPDVTGAVGDGKPAEPEAPAKDSRTAALPAEPPKGTGSWTPVPLPDGRPRSPAEIAVLERLQQRRDELEARGKELDMRESLLKAAEKRLEARLAELKDLESRIGHMVEERDEADAARLKGVITMYENMKAKDAAKVFDRLDIKVLVEVATRINPRRMSDILAQMSPDAAERLTVELAGRSGSKDLKDSQDPKDAKDKPAELPKIDGKPSPN